MVRKYYSLTIILIVLLMGLVDGCSPTPTDVPPTFTTLPQTATKIPPTATEMPVTLAEPSPTPELGIVWSEDKIGSLVGWEDDLIIFHGAGKVHKSEVSIGTWSFDIFMPEELGSSFMIGLSMSEARSIDLGIQIKRAQPDIIVRFLTIYCCPELTFGEAWRSGEELTGWHHIDVTRDDQFTARVFLDGQQILESTMEVTSTPAWFYIGGPPQSFTIDNLVVWNQVIDIQPVE